MKKLFIKLACVTSAFVCLHGVSSAQDSSAFDIYQISDVLNDRGVYTMVPKSAVIHVPRGMERKLQRQSKSKYVSFEKFIRTNCVWIQKMPVNVSQATGQAPIDPIRLENMRKLGKVVIAVHKGEPISVKLPATLPIASMSQ